MKYRPWMIGVIFLTLTNIAFSRNSACVNSVLDILYLSKIPAADTQNVKNLSHTDWDILSVKSPDIDPENLVSQYKVLFDRPSTGTLFLSTNLYSPKSGNNVIRTLSDQEKREIDKWALSVLNTVQEAYPDEKLEIENIALAVGFNAVNSWIHPDGLQTYIHSTMALRGKSTLWYHPDAKNLLYNHPQEYELLSMHAEEILDSGEMLVRRRMRAPKDGVVEDHVRLPSDLFGSANINETTTFSGLGRKSSLKEKREVEALLHSSPLFEDSADIFERVTLFLSIRPVEN